MQMKGTKANCNCQCKRTIKSKKINAMDIFVPIALLTWINSLSLCQSQFQYSSPWWHSAGNHPLQFQQQSHQQFLHSQVPQASIPVSQNQFHAGSQFQYPSYQESQQPVLQGQSLSNPLVPNTEEFLDSNGLNKKQLFVGFPIPQKPNNPWWIQNPANQVQLKPVETSQNPFGGSGGQSNKFINSHQSPASTVGNADKCHDPADHDYLLLDYLRNGLPQQNCGTDSTKHVIIVGAGISGLVAAKLLKDQGHRVTIFEASNRVGGRIQTYRNLEDNWQNEYGPMRIPKNHLLTRELISRFGLEMAPFYNKAHAYFVQDKRIPERDYVEGSPQQKIHQYLFSKFNVERPEEMKAATMILADALAQPIKDFGSLPWKEFIQKYDQYSMKQWLYQHANVSQPSIALTGIFNNLEPFIDSGLVENVLDECVYSGTDNIFDYVLHGFDLIPRGFLPDLEDDIVYKAKVSEIKQYTSGVQVRFSCKGVDCSEKESTVKGDFVIVTTTAPTALGINYDPSLSSHKRYALRTARYTAATKVLLAFETPFWERENGLLKGGSTFTDLNVKQIYYPQRGQNDNSTVHVLVASYTWGMDADRFDGMNTDDIISTCLKDVAAVHDRDFEFVKKNLREGVVKQWANDPLTLGGFAMFSPYQYNEIEDLLKAREGRISFSGEHTATPHGWINTGIKSGIRAALEVDASTCQN